MEKGVEYFKRLDTVRSISAKTSKEGDTDQQISADDYDLLYFAEKKRTRLRLDTGAP